MKRIHFYRCDGCDENDRSINCSVPQMPYHMFFLSPEYTEPNTMMVYSIEHEMFVTNDDCIKSANGYNQRSGDSGSKDRERCSVR